MQGLSFTLSTATLFLVLCLQLGINEGQDNTSTQKALIFDLNVPATAEENEEITVKLQIQSEYRECLVAKAYLVSSEPMEGSFNYIQTRCLCNDHPTTFYWDFKVTKTVKFAVVVDLVEEYGICPADEAVVPFKRKRYYTYRIIKVN
ncbi:prolactin-inducible protein homolog [Apodemus sylvaticus]|uniref:prolactin-inducible protein homolog n=1 Tax=Apodemus sylvaticus TaxID=10129 RepID=UPI0022439D60|nr:prolactin-inducible protein homolog [Apodemus sylvaticus]